MPATHNDLQRLDIRFRAEPVRGHRQSLPGGWLLWCLLGLATGLGCWLFGRQTLTERLAAQLSESGSTAEALLAVEGLLLLDAEASLEIVQGLQHSDPRVARAAYRTLDAQITRWQTQENTLATARMRSLASRLERLPASTSPANLMLASSLASRIYTRCLEQDDPQLSPIIATCETVFRRAGAAQVESTDDATDPAQAELNALAARIDAMTPPPPLPATARIQDEHFTDASAAPVVGSTDQDMTAPTATVQMVASRTRPRSEELTSSGSARVGQPQAMQETSFSLSDQIEVGSSGHVGDASLLAASPSVVESTAVTPEAPVVVRTPASLSSTPIVQMKFVSDRSDLDGIQDLEIEELVRLLASVQPRVAQAAALALRAKGMSDENLALASQLATGSAAQRLDMVQRIASRGDLEPRPWLLWMAEDGEPEVRKLAVSLLSSMLDAHVERSLRVLLTRERDPLVDKAIREVLLAGQQNYRPGNSLRPTSR